MPFDYIDYNYIHPTPEFWVNDQVHYQNTGTAVPNYSEYVTLTGYDNALYRAVTNTITTTASNIQGSLRAWIDPEGRVHAVREPKDEDYPQSDELEKFLDEFDKSKKEKHEE